MNKVTAHIRVLMYRSSQDINIIYSKFSFVYVVIDIY